VGSFGEVLVNTAGLTLGHFDGALEISEEDESIQCVG
jgi:hypothetical protein